MSFSDLIQAIVPSLIFIFILFHIHMYGICPELDIIFGLFEFNQFDLFS